MKKNQLIETRDGDRTLYFRRLPAVRPDGVCAVLAGYRKNGRDHWY